MKKSFFRHGIGLDGSSVRGFAHIDDSDLLLLPDVTTGRTVPISFKERMICTVIADVYDTTSSYTSSNTYSKNTTVQLAYNI
jgi:glutamine synthetase